VNQAWKEVVQIWVEVQPKTIYSDEVRKNVNIGTEIFTEKQGD
jgi:hypothetical protein